jgi:hypothetical protein
MRRSTKISATTEAIMKFWCFRLLLSRIDSRNPKKSGHHRLCFLDFFEFFPPSRKERKVTKNAIVVRCHVRGLEPDWT